MEREIEETGIGKYFLTAVSATSDYRLLKKSPDFFKNLCDDLAATPERIIHVGDHLEHDYAAPRRHGIESYFLSREESPPDGSHSVRDLREFARLVL
jgi:FMN phosphatase YigB (HAD superfamily)